MSPRPRALLAPAALLPLLMLLLVAVPACEDKELPTGPAPSGAHDAGGVSIPTGGACNVVVADQPRLPAPHVLACSYVPYTQSNPPSSGPHYPVWAQFKTYASPVPRGFLVHDLEHGGVVLSYDCPQGCTDEIAKAQTIIDAAVDPGCAAEPAGANKRITMTPDPLLDARFALSAWGHTLTASCVDEAAFGAFLKAHLGKTGPDGAPEDICGGGVDVLATPLPAKCGAADFSP